MQVISRGGFEAVPLIEASRLIVLRMHENGSPTDDLGAFHRPPKCVQQHMGTYLLALLGYVDRQAGEQNHRYVLGPL